MPSYVLSQEPDQEILTTHFSESLTIEGARAWMDELVPLLQTYAHPYAYHVMHVPGFSIGFGDIMAIFQERMPQTLGRALAGMKMVLIFVSIHPLAGLVATLTRQMSPSNISVLVVRTSEEAQAYITADRQRRVSL